MLWKEKVRTREDGRMELRWVDLPRFAEYRDALPNPQQWGPRRKRWVGIGFVDAGPADGTEPLVITEYGWLYIPAFDGSRAHTLRHDGYTVRELDNGRYGIFDTAGFAVENRANRPRTFGSAVGAMSAVEKSFPLEVT